MSTLISALITNARTTLNETSATFWTDAELLVHAIDGIKDLWKAILDLDKGHFVVIDDTHVSLAANSSSLTGVPTDVFRIESLEVQDLSTANSVQNCTFEYRRLNDADFQSARSLDAQDPSGQTIFFSLLNAGAPVGAPTVEVAPQITATVPLRLIYTQTVGPLTSASTNPIPGESDHALQCWIIAHALAKEREDAMPHPGWLQMYATDKATILKSLTPRQTQDVETADALFESWSW